MRCLAVLGGEFSGIEALRSWASVSDFIVGVDHGLDHIQAAGLSPSAVVGDMDSVEQLPLFAEELIHKDEDRDRSDVEKMFTLAKRAGVREVVMICAHGGRVDHLLAGFSAAIATDFAVRWVFPEEHVALIRPGFKGNFSTGVAKRFSLMPLDGTCEVSLLGGRWPLHGAELRVGQFWSLSNETVDPAIQLEVRGGHLALFVAASPAEIPEW